MPPNILFLLTDQQRSDTLGCYGNPVAQTPHIDRIAADAAVFERAYCNEPICTPSRASLLTGRYPHAIPCTVNDQPLPRESKTIAERLGDDWVRYYSGKWHLGDEIVAQHGFDHWLSVEDGYRDGYSDPELLKRFCDYHHYLLQQGFKPEHEFCGAMTFSRRRAAQMLLEHSKPVFQARDAVRFIREPRDNPFFCMVSFVEPHRPFYSALEHLHSPESIPVGREFRRPPAEDAAVVKRILAAHFRRKGTVDGEDINTEAGCRRLRARYQAMCTQVDHAVGMILEALEASGQADRTIIVYASDHGELLGDHECWGKSCTYENSIRVPLIIRAPGMPARRIDRPAGLVDLAPTLLELTGHAVPSELQGRSLVPLLETGAEPDGDDRVAVVEFEGTNGIPKTPPEPGFTDDDIRRARAPWRTIITADGWKLNLSAGDRPELFDLNADPTESRNLFDSPDHRTRANEMTARLRAWQEQTSDTVPVTT